MDQDMIPRLLKEKSMIVFRYIMIILFLFISSAPGNKVFLRTIPLEQLVRLSDMILVVRPLKPFMASESIKIPGYNKRESSKIIPDFQTHSLNVEVLRVVSDRLHKNLTGAKIAIYPAYAQEGLYLHTKYYAEGIAKSPLNYRYDSILSEESLEKENEFVAFVTYSWTREGGQTDFEFTAARSFDRAEVIPKVEEMLKKVNQTE